MINIKPYSNYYTKMASTGRLAIVDPEKCKPKKCNQECKRICPIERQGIQCVDIEAVAKIYDSACIGCGMCTSNSNGKSKVNSNSKGACPFNAITIVNIPKEITGMITHRFVPNGFRLYKMPILKPNQITGILGSNGIGKSTVIKILSNKLKPNFEDEKALDDHEIIKRFKGNEMHKYLEKLYSGKLQISVKPQQIDVITSMLRIKKQDPDVQTFIAGYSAYDSENQQYKNVIETLDLGKILTTKVRALSGGQLQLVAISCCILKKSDVYIFDEPSNYLDVRQRLNVAKLITELKGPDKYVMVIEHDLAILDYISDSICIMYGTPGAYGVVAIPYSTAEAINIYFDGYIPAENMKFRSDEFQIKQLREADDDTGIETREYTYDGTVIEYPNFKLLVDPGTFPASSSITLILGKNGTGKTTLLNYLSKHLGFSISYKYQICDLSVFQNKNGTYPTVEELFFDKIKESYTSELFRSDIIRPLNMSQINHRQIDELSGGELNRVLTVLCLGTKADVYLIDEPSACLDIEQRVLMTKIIKRFIMHNHKIAFVVEHDMMMAVSLMQEPNSRVILLESLPQVDDTRLSQATKSMNPLDGINTFLKSLDITFRTDTKYAKHSRPRINKYNSAKDRDQKKEGKYYQTA
jgi:ATP-binding cassette subfamily E protein 1